MQKIKKVWGGEIFDSRGNPTVEVDIILDTGVLSRASVPSGASTGKLEALELRDKDGWRLSGKGVLKAVDNINQIIAPKIKGRPASFEDIDKLLLDLDATENKSRLGANAILAVSLAVAKAAALSERVSFYRYLAEDKSFVLPIPLMNILNGGLHAENNLDIQEFMIAPSGADSFHDALRMGTEVFHHLKSILKSRKLKDGY